MNSTDFETEAKERAEAVAESFERSDTDGFLSQWANGLHAELYRTKADLAKNNNLAEFPALFDLNGDLVPAKLISTRYGLSWGILASDDPTGEIVAWVSAFPKRVSTMEKKGYREGRVIAPANASLQGPKDATGIGGALSVRVVVFRTDKGFSRNVQVVSTKEGQVS